MRKTFSLLAAGLLSAALLVPAQAQISSAVDAVSQAGLQRMLGQRILKDYALITLGVKASASQKDLSETLKRYDTILFNLKSYPAAAESQAILDEVINTWETVSRIASASPQKSQVAELHQATEALLEVNEELTRALAERGAVKSAAIVNVSGRQRMLSQRIASLYMLKALGLDEETFAESMENATFEFKLAQEELRDSDINNRAIKNDLKKVSTQFKMLEFSVGKGGNTYFPSVVSNAAEKILERMTDITAEYVALASGS